MIKDINKFKKEYMRIHNLGDKAKLADIQKLSIMKKQYNKRFNDLKMSDYAHVLLIEDIAKFMSCTNGVGSEVGWFNRTMRWLVPRWIRNRLFGVDITPASDGHDVEYSIKIDFKCVADGELFKRTADTNFKENMFIIIKRDKHVNLVNGLRFVKARIYFGAVGYCGSASFWKGKIKPKV